MAERTVVAEVSLFGKIASYIEIMVRDPHSTVFVHLCEVYLRLGLVDEAIEVARKGTVTVPDYPDGFIALAHALVEKQDLHGAAEAFRTALDHEPGHLHALTGLSRIYLQSGQPDQAIALLRQAHQLAPEDQVVKQLLDELPATADSTKQLHQNVAPQPQVVSVSSPQTQIPTLLPSVTETAAESHAPPISTATIADIYIRQGFPERALKVYTDLLLSEPGNAEIRKRYEELHALIASGDKGATDAVSSELAVEQVSIASSPAAAGSPADLLAIYQRWLDVLQGRRAHV